MITKGLISKSPHIENILSGNKTWEIRGSNTKIRGDIALIKSGSGTVVGKCSIVDVIGPLEFRDLKQNIDKHCVPHNQLLRVLGKYKKPYAWIISNASPLQKPIPYNHPHGAIIWVNLEREVIKLIQGKNIA